MPAQYEFEYFQDVEIVLAKIFVDYSANRIYFVPEHLILDIEYGHFIAFVNKKIGKMIQFAHYGAND